MLFYLGLFLTKVSKKLGRINSVQFNWFNKSLRSLMSKITPNNKAVNILLLSLRDKKCILLRVLFYLGLFLTKVSKKLGRINSVQFNWFNKSLRSFMSKITLDNKAVNI